MSSVQEITSQGFALTASVWFFAGQLDESEQVRHVPIRTMPFLIGRRNDLPLCIPCSCVSKLHAELFERDGELWLRDLGSTNGTYVNGIRITTEAKLRDGDIVQFATVVFRVGRQDESDDDGSDGGTIHEDACDRALAMVQFDRLIHDRAVVPFYQPIVKLESGTPHFGFEVLGRSRLFGLRTPKEMFATASQLNLEAELSRVFRLQGIEVAKELNPALSMFVNTHPVELIEDGLLDSLRELRELAPQRRMTLEIHEATVTNPQMIRNLRDNLRDLDMELAFDDFGAGQARLIELTEVRPDYIKFDMKLIQGIHQAPPSRQQVVALLTRMVNELGIVPIAEGVENAEEDEILRQMGFQMGQGFYYGRPASISSYQQAT
ncbi:MAG: EAL domain-containing protein [Planctomycetales bacterium]|nr:EAL domain-containing protein [Planctomycetales bacterium]MCA9169130.1 EAL domain-containing protein [Planctomycetales bacterium]